MVIYIMVKIKFRSLGKMEPVKKASNIKLHMIGKLQTNKVKFAVPLFDYIHSLDNLKLAQKISSEQKKLIKKLNFHSSKHWQ